MRTWGLMIALCCFLHAPVALGAGCIDARALHAQAVAAPTPAEKVPLLESAAAQCPDFAIFYELGKAQAGTGAMKKAQHSFLSAAKTGITPQERARAYHNAGVISENDGDFDAAAASYKSALKEQYSPEVEQRLVVVETARSGIVSAEKIAAELLSATKGLGVAASIDLRVQFETNAYNLTDEGRRQAEEIARMMMSEAFNGKGFRIIGHTDLRGSEEYNNKLSFKRAEALKTYLVKKQGIDSSLLRVEGRGKSEPLFLDSGDEAQALNRRVQIEVQ